MRNFRKILLRVILVFAFLFLFNSTVRFVYEPASNNLNYSKNDLEENEGKIETMILGTSLLHWGLNGQTLGEILDSTTFNMATSAQPVNGSYFLLKDQGKRNPIKRVFLGVHATSMINDSNKYLHLREAIFDRIKSPVGKLEYMWKTAKLKEYEQYIFYPTRLDNVLTKTVTGRNLRYKLSENFRNNIPPRRQGYKYKGMGDESSDREYKGDFADKKLGNDAIWDRAHVLDVNKTYIQKIADYCRENEIELNLVITPMSKEFTRLMGDLDDMHLYFQEFCEKNGANLYDFNQYEGIYEQLPTDYYQDKKHLNFKGSIKFAQLLGDWYLQESSAKQ